LNLLSNLDDADIERIRGKKKSLFINGLGEELKPPPPKTVNKEAQSLVKSEREKRSNMISQQSYGFFSTTPGGLTDWLILFFNFTLAF